jgi:AcrR family transcriptional regulator/DNA-binding MarR family transcriptional regulator
MQADRISTRRPGVRGPRGGGHSIPGFQRTRLLDAAVALVAAEGYRRMTARRVSGWAGVSNKTFYDLFSDREDCFLAAFDRAIDELSAIVLPAWESEKEWSTRVRAALGALLGALDREPAVCTLVSAEALGAGPRVLERRVEVLRLLAGAIDEGRAGARASGELSPLTAEGIVGAVFGVIYARLIQNELGPFTDLMNPLMATIVLPYRGHAASARELEREVLQLAPASIANAGGGASIVPLGERSNPIDFRLTVRTQMVLTAVANRPGASNRQVSDAAGVADQGQISRLLTRLEGLELLRNAGGETQGIPNAWHLTPRGEEIARLTRTEEHGSSQGAQR